MGRLCIQTSTDGIDKHLFHNYRRTYRFGFGYSCRAQKEHLDRSRHQHGRNSAYFRSVHRVCVVDTVRSLFQMAAVSVAYGRTHDLLAQNSPKCLQANLCCLRAQKDSLAVRQRYVTLCATVWYPFFQAFCRSLLLCCPARSSSSRCFQFPVLAGSTWILSTTWTTTSLCCCRAFTV